MPGLFLCGKGHLDVQLDPNLSPVVGDIVVDEDLHCYEVKLIRRLLFRQEATLVFECDRYKAGEILDWKEQ